MRLGAGFCRENSGEIGENRVGEKFLSLSSTFPFYSCSWIWQGARRAGVHAVHLPKESVPRTKRRWTACSGARRASSILLIPRLKKVGTACSCARRAAPIFLHSSTLKGAERRATVHAVLMFQRRASWVVWWTARRAALHGVQSLCCAKSNLDLLSRTPNALHITVLASWSDPLSP